MLYRPETLQFVRGPFGFVSRHRKIQLRARPGSGSRGGIGALDRLLEGRSRRGNSPLREKRS